MYTKGTKINNWLANYPAVLAALISGIVSILIASIAGVYTIYRSRKELEEYKKKLIRKVFSTNAAENFISSFTDYQEKYREHVDTLHRLSENPDGRELAQCMIDFYAEFAKPLIENFPDFIPSNVMEAHAEMEAALAALAQHIKPNDQSTHNYSQDMFKTGERATRLLSKVRPR